MAAKHVSEGPLEPRSQARPALLEDGKVCGRAEAGRARNSRQSQWSGSAFRETSAAGKKDIGRDVVAGRNEPAHLADGVIDQLRLELRRTLAAEQGDQACLGLPRDRRARKNRKAWRIAVDG